MWRSRAFEEMFYMQLPRVLFLTGSIWMIYKITMKQKAERHTATVTAHYFDRKTSPSLEHALLKILCSIPFFSKKRAPIGALLLDCDQALDTLFGIKIPR